MNQIRTDGATNWLRAKLLAFQFAVLRAKVRGGSCSCRLWNASRYFLAPEGTRAHSPTEKWAAAESFKVWTRFLRETREKEHTSRKRARAKQRTKLRVDGEECCRQERQETETEGEWKGRDKKLCHRPRWVTLSIARASVGKADGGWVFTVRLSSCRRRPYVSPFYEILSFIDAEQPNSIPSSPFREWRARAGQTAVKFDRWNRPFVIPPILSRDGFLFTTEFDERAMWITFANSKINY